MHPLHLTKVSQVSGSFKHPLQVSDNLAKRLDNFKPSKKFHEPSQYFWKLSSFYLTLKSLNAL